MLDPTIRSAQAVNIPTSMIPDFILPDFLRPKREAEKLLKSVVVQPAVEAPHKPRKAAHHERERGRVALLMRDIQDYLRQYGPTSSEQIRNEIGVASTQRYSAAIKYLREDQAVEIMPTGAESACLRLVGDKRTGRTLPRTGARQ